MNAWGAIIIAYGRDTAESLVQHAVPDLRSKMGQLVELVRLGEYNAAKRLSHDVKGITGMLRIDCYQDAMDLDEELHALALGVGVALPNLRSRAVGLKTAVDLLQDWVATPRSVRLKTAIKRHRGATGKGNQPPPPKVVRKSTVRWDVDGQTRSRMKGLEACVDNTTECGMGQWFLSGLPELPATNKIRVLLVEDSKAQAIAIEHRLVEAGLLVTVRSGLFAAAIAVAELTADCKHQYDFVLTDLHLGGASTGQNGEPVDGLAVCAAAIDAGIFALLMTADALFCPAAAEPNVRFVSKPITMSQVHLMIMEYRVEVRRRGLVNEALTLAWIHPPSGDGLDALRNERDELVLLVEKLNAEFGVLVLDNSGPPMTEHPDTEDILTKRLLRVARLQNAVLNSRLQTAVAALEVSGRHVTRLNELILDPQRGALEVTSRSRLVFEGAVVSDRAVVQIVQSPQTLEVLASPPGRQVYGVKMKGDFWLTFSNVQDRNRFCENVTQRFPALETDRLIVDVDDWPHCQKCGGVVHVNGMEHHRGTCHRL